MANSGLRSPRMPASFHSTLSQGGLPRSGRSRRAGEDIGKAQLPVHEAPLRGPWPPPAMRGKVLAQLADAQLAKLVVQVGLVGGRSGSWLTAPNSGLHFGSKMTWGASGGRRASPARLGRQVDDVAFQDGAHLHPPLLAAGQLALAGDGPEPQRAPVVHHQLQAAEGRGQVAVFIEQALAADGFLLGAAEQVIGPRGPGARGLSCGQTSSGSSVRRGRAPGPWCARPTARRWLAELLQAGHFVRFQRRVEGLAPLLEALEVVRVELLGHLVGVVWPCRGRAAGSARSRRLAGLAL
jgi:hypothetical protein